MKIPPHKHFDEVNFDNHTCEETVEFLKSKDDPKIRMIILWLIRYKHLRNGLYNARVELANAEKCIDIEAASIK